MFRIFVTIMWLIIISIKRNTECRNEVLAISGCNATLEWLIGESFMDALSNSIKVFDSDGKIIVTAENMACKPVMDRYISCKIRNDSNEKWWVSMVLVNVTQAKSGTYTGQKNGWMVNEANVTKELKIIDKLHITEATKPILHEPLSIMCTLDGESNELIYRWNLNGTDLNSTDSIMARSSKLTIERLALVHKLTNFSCTVCSKNKCCIESGTYSPDPYYGPISLSLNLNESDVYLRENETFTVKCSANCFARCTFRWKGYYINVEDDELKINSFVSRMSGAYTCIASNRKTGVTLESNPFFLHHVRAVTVCSSLPGDNQGLIPEQYWVGPVSACAFLLIVGFLVFVTRSCRTLSRGIGKRPKQLGEKEKRKSNDTKLQGYIYNTIDEAALSVYDYARDIATEGNSHETESHNRHFCYKYNHSVEISHTEEADVHVIDENYITPISELVHPIKICGNEINYTLGTDQSYITPISDFACKSEIPACQVEKINMLETDQTYITPVTG